jgi:inorganic triphosphatase YgiF
MEVELKLLLASEDVAALRAHPLLAQYASEPAHLLLVDDTYFDTAELRLARQGAGLRVRGVSIGEDGAEQHWCQTLKAGGDVVAGLHSRHEWETRLAAPAAGEEALPDLEALRAVVDAKGPWRKVLRELAANGRGAAAANGGNGGAAPGLAEQAAAAQSLQPLFSSAMQRSVWALRLPQGDEVEFVLDVGTLRSGERSEPVCEIEMELKTGQPLHLFDFALALLQDIPLRIGNLSKAERGYALFSPQAPAPRRAEPLRLSRGLSVEKAFIAIAANCLEHIQGNEVGVQAGDSESLHQMRVGLRRLRAALAQFRDVLALPEPLVKELDWLSSQLGPARDWDVMATSTLPDAAAQMPDPEGFAELRLAAEYRSEEMQAAAAVALASSRYARLSLGLARCLRGRCWREELDDAARKRLKQPAGALARRMLQDGRRRLLKRGRKLDKASARARHRVRIAAKKDRYASEFFRSLYPGKKGRRYIRALAGLQDELGWRNDAAVADGLLRSLPDGQSHLETPAAFLRGYLAARQRGGKRQLIKAWKKFSRARPIV